jgi:hypothetical protein
MLFVMWLIGCGHEDTRPEPPDTPDAGERRDTDTVSPVDAGAVALPPLEPRSAPYAGFADCPAGWEAVTLREGVTVCEPFPDGVVEECPVGSMQLPGDRECVRYAPPCPEGRFPDASDLDESWVIRYADAGADAQGDGSREAPWKTNIGNLPEGTTRLAVLVSEGVQRIPVGVFPAIEELRVRGLCPERTRISASPVRPPIVIERATVTATAPLRRGSWEIRFVDAWFEESLIALGGLVSLTRTSVPGQVRSIAGELRMRDVWAQDGLFLIDGAVGSTTRVRVDQGELAATTAGATVFCRSSRLDASEMVVLGTRGSGIHARPESAPASTDETRVLLRDVVVGRQVASSGPPGGQGLLIEFGGNVVLEQAWVRNVGRSGIELGLGDAAQVVHLAGTDVVVSGVRSDPLETRTGFGVRAQDAFDVDLEGLAVLRATGVGVSLVTGSNQDGSFSLRHARIEGVRANERLAGGHGVDVGLSARGTMEDVTIQGVREAGLSVFGRNSRLQASRVTIAGVTGPACAGEPGCGPFGHGIVSAAASSGGFSLSDFVVYEAAGCGVMVTTRPPPLHDGAIIGTDWGVCFASPDADPGRYDGIELIAVEEPFVLWRGLPLPRRY